MITGAQVFVRELERAGVEKIFAVPGVQLDWIFHALETEESRIEVVVPRHEQATTYMADGYARSSGKLGVALVVPGPGVLNAMSGLVTAYASHSRVLLVAGQIRSEAIGKNWGLLHEIKDQDKVLMSGSKKVFSVRSGTELKAFTRAAIEEIDCGIPGPVSIEIPHDVLESAGVDADISSRTPPIPSISSASRDSALNKAVDWLAKAKKPLIYAGGGVVLSAGCEALQTLAEYLHAPVVMSENARGALSDEHALSMSGVAAQQAFKEADCILVIGSRFVDLIGGKPLWTANNAALIGVNVDEDALGVPRNYQIGIAMDAKAALLQMFESLSKDSVAVGSEWGEQIDFIKTKALERIESLGVLSDYVKALRKAIPKSSFLVNELTQVGYLSRVAYPVSRPNELINPGYQGTLGYSFAMGLGVALGGKERAYAISGDGGFGWNIQELSTAAKYQVPLTFIIFNDERFTNVHKLQMNQFGFSKECELLNPDFPKLAQAYGIEFVGVDSPGGLEQALISSQSLSGPVMIEVKVGDMANPWPLLRIALG